MALLLHLETATRNCSVALGRDGQLLDLEEQATEGYSHAENLHPFIDRLLTRNNVDPNDLDGVCVSKGPGSYTGLRIGVSAAKGLCFALDIPLIAVTTNAVLAHHPAVEAAPNKKIVTVIDARRMEVYTQTFDADRKPLGAIEAVVVDENTFAGLEPFVLVGDGAAKLEEVTLGLRPDLQQRFPSARDMVQLGEEAFKNKDFEDVAYFEPFYLKDFIAGIPKKLI